MSKTEKKESWITKSLNEIVAAKRGISYSGEQLGQKDKGHPLYINMKTFRKDGSYNTEGEKHFGGSFGTKDLLNENELLIVNTDVTPQGDILGVPLKIPKKYVNSPILYSHHVTALKHNHNVTKDFLYYKLCEERIRKDIRSYGRGTTVKMLNLTEILEIQIELPPLKEQQKIAEILTSVDEVIENTQSQIDKLEDLKKATMNELLTKGIGHTEFKETEIGRIPKSWKVLTLGEMMELIKPGPFGSSITKSNYVESGYKVYGQEQVIRGDASFGDYFISKAKYED